MRNKISALILMLLAGCSSPKAKSADVVVTATTTARFLVSAIRSMDAMMNPERPDFQYTTVPGHYDSDAQRWLTLNMANTVSPLIQHMTGTACREPQGWQHGRWAMGSALIYKREPCGNFDAHGMGYGCIDKTGNQYYARCYAWTWVGDDLFYKPLRDVRLPAYSCIDESQIEIPYEDDQLRHMRLGVIYKVRRS